MLMGGKTDWKNFLDKKILEYIVQLVKDVGYGWYADTKTLAQNGAAWRAASN